MPKIIWEGNQEWEKEHPGGEIPENGVKLKRADDILKASLPYGILPVLLCFFCVFLKKSTSGEFIFDLRFIPVSFLLGFAAMPLHEFLHAICYPKGAVVYVGVCLKKVAAYAVSFYPIRKSRYIVMSLAPVLLGIVPLVIFLLCPVREKAVLTLCVVPAFMGLVSPSPDYMDVISIIRQVPNGALIQATNQGLYWIK